MNATPDATLHLDHWRIIRGRVGLVALVFLLTLGGATIFTYLNPQNYIASATIDIQTDETQQSVVQGSTAESTKNSNLAESPLQAPFSHDVLDPIIRRLDLAKKWSQKDGSASLDSAYDKLRRMVVFETLAPHSIRISVQSTSPQEATLLANSIA